MRLSRRAFLKLSGATVGGLLLSSKPVGIALAQGIKPFPLHKRIGETPTICCFCSVGCGAIVAASNGQVENIEGDPDHPVNRGALCSKGAALAQIHNNERRLTKPLYRAPGASEWREKSWEEALADIARKIKTTRDATWEATDAEARIVNRTLGIASVGGAAHDNEECYLMVKALRALGLVYIEHQARI